MHSSPVTSSPPTAVTPEPGSLLLLGSGTMGLHAGALEAKHRQVCLLKQPMRAGQWAEQAAEKLRFAFRREQGLVARGFSPSLPLNKANGFKGL